MGELLLEPSQCWLEWQEQVTLHTKLRTAWACSDEPLLLLCMCCPLAPELEGWARGAIGPFLEGEGRKCPSKEGCCSEPRSRQQSSVFALPPWREEAFRQGGPQQSHAALSVSQLAQGTCWHWLRRCPCPVPCLQHPPPLHTADWGCHSPALAALLASAPLLRQGCVRWRWLVVDHCCGHAEGFLQALLHLQLGREGGETE